MKISKRTVWMLAIAAIVVVGGWYYFARSSSGMRMVTAKVTEGPIVRSVTATGTVNPVITVQLGTYVSGPIIAIYDDYNAAGDEGAADRENRPEHLPGDGRYRAGDAGELEGATGQGPGRPRLQEGHLGARPRPVQGRRRLEGRARFGVQRVADGCRAGQARPGQYPAADGQRESRRGQSQLHQYRLAG